MKIENYKELELRSNYKGLDFKKYIAEKCVEIANTTNFPTDYDDVFDHIFGNEELIKVFLTDEEIIKGFIVSDYFDNKLDDLRTLKALYIHGIIIDKDTQKHGLFRNLVNYTINSVNYTDYIALRTHNPRCANAFTNCMLEHGLITSPTLRKVDSEIIKIANNDKYIYNANANLVAKGVYDRELLSQRTSNEYINEMFKRNNVEENDAQCLIALKKVKR